MGRHENWSFDFGISCSAWCMPDLVIEGLAEDRCCFTNATADMPLSISRMPIYKGIMGSISKAFSLGSNSNFSRFETPHATYLAHYIYISEMYLLKYCRNGRVSPIHT